MKIQFGINYVHQLESGSLHAVCACVNTKPLKCTCNSRNDLNGNSYHRNLKNNVFELK